jgi:hypothetical protein
MAKAATVLTGTEAPTFAAVYTGSFADIAERCAADVGFVTTTGVLHQRRVGSSTNIPLPHDRPVISWIIAVAPTGPPSEMRVSLKDVESG